MPDFIDEIAAQLGFGDDPETVTVEADDGNGFREYKDWDQVQVTRSLDQFVGSFSISFADAWRDAGNKWPLKPGTEVKISFGNEQILRGYVDTLKTNISSSDRKVNIQGRDKTGDLIDCSAPITKTEYKDISIGVLANILVAPFGLLAIDESVGAETFKKWHVRQGESVFETLDRAAKQLGLLLQTDEKSNVIITNRIQDSGSTNITPSAGGVLAAVQTIVPAPVADLVGGTGDLTQGENILSASASYDDSQRFSEYKVLGQSPGSDQFAEILANSAEGNATDDGIKRYRPKVLISESASTAALAKTRAEWEATLGARNSIDVNVSVQSWLKGDGSLWKVGDVVNLDARFVGIASNMLITGITFTKSTSGGTLANLRLTRADAFKPASSILSDDDPVQDLGWDGTTFGKIVERISRLIT